MKKTAVILFCFLTLLMSCNDRKEAEIVPASEAKVETESDNSPKSFSEALAALDRRYSSEEKSSFLLMHERPFGGSHKIMGMQLRNEWGLWKDSALKRYFSERGIAHADWITSAIFEGWADHLQSGAVDEEKIISEYAAIEKQWREKGAERNADTESSSDDSDPFAENED